MVLNFPHKGPAIVRFCDINHVRSGAQNYCDIKIFIHDRYTNREEGPMVHISVIEARLSQLGFRASRWFKPEIRELQHILMDNEKIVGCVAGRYFGGFALIGGYREQIVAYR
jgi:hypothetical protein